MDENTKIKRSKYAHYFEHAGTERQKDFFDNLEKFNEQLFSEQLYKFREDIKKHLIFILYAELSFLGILLILQGFQITHLNQWAFGFFINGCLVQTFFLIHTVVRHLFPPLRTLIKHRNG